MGCSVASVISQRWICSVAQQMLNNSEHNDKTAYSHLPLSKSTDCHMAASHGITAANQSVNTGMH